MPDLTSCISFGSILPKMVWIRLCKTGPDPIWVAWSGIGQTDLALETSRCARIIGSASGKTQPARYKFPTFRLSCVLPQMSRIILCKTSPDVIWFQLTIRFWPNRSGPEASRCARIIGHASGQRLPSRSRWDANRIQHVYLAGNEKEAVLN